MPWYRTGTISVTNGSTTVTGSGTSWVTNALTGEGLQAPDGRVYEIASITSATQLTLASAYLGSNQTGQTYAILPTHTFAKDLASEVSALVVDYQTSKSDFDAGSFSKGTTAAPGINFGVDGQSNTGFTNETTGEIGISIAGTNRGKITATGLNGAAIGATTAAAGTFTNLTANTTLVVPGATTPAQTAEGSVVWDTDSDLLTVGTGAGRKTMVDTDSTQTLTNKTLTTLTTSSTVTHNGGTANGVAYLNGSKVLTTGSALTFDGSNLGIGTGSPGSKLFVQGIGHTIATIKGGSGSNQGSAYYVQKAGSTDTLAAFGDSSAIIGGTPDSSVTVYTGLSAPLIFNVAGAECARIDTSGNLGIGTSSPTVITAGSRVLEVSGAGDYFPSINLARTGATGYTNVTWKQFLSSDGGLYFRQNSTDRLVIDSSGNLGLGVTPSAWGGYRALQISNAAVSSAASTSVVLSANAYNLNGTGWRYISAAAATQYEQFNGGHYWSTAPSGTAGNAISFTQAMTLDASNNLLLGTTAGVPSGTGMAIYSPTAARLQLRNSTTGDASGNGCGLLAFGSDLYVENRENGATLFFNNGSERARITSGGNLLVGTTSTLTAFSGAAVTAAGITGMVAQSSVVGNEAGAFWNTATAGDNLFVIFGTEATYTGRGSITYNRAGGLVAYNTTSDYRAKDIIGPVQNPGAAIDALKVYEGVMKGATQSRPMLIAHEAQEHAPYAVSGVKDEVNEDGTPKFQQMDVSSLVPLLLAEIQSLRARVAALESN